MTTTATYTPWGWPDDVVELARGVWRVWTPGHGGLRLSPERWDELPAVVRDTLLNPHFAEEDCEEPIVRTLLGVGDDGDREMALRVAGHFDRYAPAIPFIRRQPSTLHYHVLLHRGGSRPEPFRRFDTRSDAESFAGDPEKARKYGRMKAFECWGVRPPCLDDGGRS